MRGFRKIFLVLALLLAVPVTAVADDGYDLWLRYKPVEARWLAPYRAANTVLVTGAASPTLDAAFPFLPWLFGGRQSARTIHFLCAFSFVLFFVVHIVMVILSGTWNNLRSMITDRYEIEEPGGRNV